MATMKTARGVVHLVRDGLRSQLWPLPVLGVVIAVALGMYIPHLDVLVDAHLPSWLDTVVFNGGAGAARTVLDTVASSLITVTSLTFSLTVVTLQLASSQFSPRLLRTFTQDVFVQVTLMIFLATFTYSITVLRSVRSGDTGSSPFVPRLAVTTSFLLALASVIVLALFLAHLTRQIRVETMLRNVQLDAAATITSTLESRAEVDQQPAIVRPPAGATTLWAWKSGFLQSVDSDKLCAQARAAGVTLAVQRHPGDFVVVGTPIASAWPMAGEQVSAEAWTALRDKLPDAIRLGPERTAGQDVGFGLRQLTDVANKALSPGINDPTTAVHALGHSAALLSKLTDYALGPKVLRDDDQTVRVIIDRPDFADYLDLALSQPRSYGQGDHQVLGQLYALLRDVAWHAHAAHHQPLRDQLRRLRATVRSQDFDEVQVAQLEAAHAAVDAVLGRSAHPSQGPSAD